MKQLRLQFRLRTLIASTTVAAIAVWLYWNASPRWREYRLANELRTRILASSTSHEAGNAFRSLIQLTGRESLRRLSEDKELTIALKAGFELHNVRTNVDRLEPEHAKAFLDFLERKAGLKPPDWWAGGLADRFPWPNSQAKHVVVLDVDSLMVGDRVVAIDNKVIRRIQEWSREAVYATTLDHLHLAVYDTDVGMRFDLYRIDPKTGSIGWQSRCWALGVENIGGTSGPWSHAVEISIKGDSVIVWGAGTGGSYVEAFDAATGTNLFRFCTEYWYSR